MRLKNKHILITGGSSGIGLSLVECCAKEGAKVSFTYRSDGAIHRDSVTTLMKKYPSINAIKADFSNPAIAEQLISEVILPEFGIIDVLVNNAAAFSRNKLVETDFHTLNNILNINLIAPFLLISAFSKPLIAASKPGSIINVSSLSATVARSEMAAYQCSKAGLEMLSTSAAYELAAHQIRSNVIAPGLTETEANEPQRINQPEVWKKRAASIPIGRPGKPADYNGAVIYLASDESTWVTGAKITIDGGANTF